MIHMVQRPQMRPDGTVYLLGVRDANFCNTNHVPVWYESIGKYSWGEGNSDLRTVKTGGKEKDRFTVQFCMTKNGDKLIPFIIFKGDPKS